MATSRRAVYTDQAPKPLGPYSQAIILGNLVFCAGQVGINPATGQVVDGGVEAQARQVIANIHAVLAAAGTSFDRVVKTTIFLTNVGDFAAVNKIYGEAVGDPPPARSTVGVAGLPGGAVVEIEVIAEVG